ncbi:MAG TPA: hypothetical protein VJ248_08355, partial [Candidatus Udaeobacter sp.]|nr:hypothetical protein [Candidatus Udaeobacter sp.]
MSKTSKFFQKTLRFGLDDDEKGSFFHEDHFQRPRHSIRRLEKGFDAGCYLPVIAGALRSIIALSIEIPPEILAESER